MNGRQFLLGASGNPLAQILGLVLFVIFAIGAVIMGAFVLLGIVGLAFIGFAVLAVRGWWLQRKMRRRFGSDQPGPQGHAQGRRLIEAEYEVIDTDSDERRAERDERGNG
jgi:membrane protein implicated in regulation of membrane protease activity